MTDKELYRELCAKEPTIPLYSMDWWLDCVCGENKWDVLLYRNKERIESAMPFYSPLKNVITMPAYTQTMGIWFNPESENPKYSENLYRKQQICSYFIERLPAHSFFLQNFHSSFTDWLPFYWKGFKQTTRYNYVLTDVKDSKEIEKKRNNNIRQNIKKAHTKYKIEIKNQISADLFLKIYAKSFERQGEKSYKPEILRRLIETTYLRNQGDIWGAFDQSGQLHAAVFVVWQGNCAYYIAGGSDEMGRKSGGQILSMSEAIKAVSSVCESFDFEGSMMPGVERVFRSFGAIQKPYFTISKGNRPWIRTAIEVLRNYLTIHSK